MTRSGLRGRGGAGFPTGIKWKTVHDAPGPRKYIVCNADEGDSGTFADRMLMEGDPFCLIEGMAIAGHAVGAGKGFVYIRSEYPDAIAVMQEAARIWAAAGLTPGFDVEIRVGAGAYVCGEETSLLNSLEGKRGVVLRFGQFSEITMPGPHWHIPFPIEQAQIVDVGQRRFVEVGYRSGAGGSGQVSVPREALMLTRDENIVDITFQTVWNVRDPAQYLFNLSDPQATIQAVADSAMREVVSRSDLSPILSRDRGVISQEVQELVQETLDEYGSGVNIVRVNFLKADPPTEVIDAFREVQAARQERSTLQNRADAYANERLAAARGQSAQLLQEAESYRAQQVNSAAGEASRFSAVLEEYLKAPDVTRKRLYLETMENVLGDVQMFLVDTPSGGGQGIVPYLPLNELRRPGAAGAAGSTGEVQ